MFAGNGLAWGRCPSVRFDHYNALLVELGEWDDDATYPVAPLPIHERSWRHPSELGAAVWADTEPPLVVGRSLAVASGVIGAVLSLGILWLLVPHAAGPGVATQSSVNSAQRLPGLDPPVASMSLAVAIAPTTTTRQVEQGAATTEAAPPKTTLKNAVEDPPKTIVAASTIVSVDPGPGDIAPIPEPVRAIAFAEQHYVATSWNEAANRTDVTVLLPSGTNAGGTVVWADAASHIVVIALQSVQTETVFVDSVAVVDAPVSIVGSPLLQAKLVANDSSEMTIESNIPPSEADIVVDQANQLVGLCTMVEGHVLVIAPEKLRLAIAQAKLAELPTWLGLATDPYQVDALHISAVTGGAAADADLQPGDIVAGVDGVALTTAKQLSEALAGHQPGDTIAVSVYRLANPTVPTDVLLKWPTAIEPSKQTPSTETTVARTTG